MTSVVDTSVKFMRYATPGVPTLNGQAGSLISVLDAFLVTGYGLTTASSLVVADGVATLGYTGTMPAEVDSVIQVAGSSIDALNGEQKVTSKTGAAISFATAAANGTASGTITFRLAPAGWQKVFAGTNKAVYRSLSPEGYGMLLRVDDSGSISARVVGYESMSDVDTGSGAFPTSAQVAGGGYWLKSTVASAAASGYVLVADSRFLLAHLMPAVSGNAAHVLGATRGFGDTLALRPSGDAFAAVLNYSTLSSVNASDSSFDSGGALQCAMPRSYTGLGSGVLHARAPLMGQQAGQSGSDPSFGAFPSLIDGSLLLSRMCLVSAAGQPPRSIVPGGYYSPQSQLGVSFVSGDRVPGRGELAGRSLMALNTVNTGSGFSAVPGASHGAFFVDITGPWR